jgi:hypothetical protein
MDKINLNFESKEPMSEFMFRHALKTINKNFHQNFHYQASSEKLVIYLKNQHIEKNIVMLGALLESLHIAAIQRGCVAASKLIFEQRSEGFLAAEVIFLPCRLHRDVHVVPAIDSDMSVRIRPKFSNYLKTLFMVEKFNYVKKMMGFSATASELSFIFETSTNLCNALVVPKTLCKVGEIAYRNGLKLKSKGYGTHTMSIESLRVDNSFVVAMGAERSKEELKLFRNREKVGITVYVDSYTVVTFKQS